MSFIMTSDHPIRWILILHVLAGLAAVVALAVPYVSKKGGRVHIRSGWVFVAAMSLVVISTFIFAPWRMMFDLNLDDQSRRFSFFLIYIALFTASSLQFSLAVLKAKNRVEPELTFKRTFAPRLTLMLGVSLQILGFMYSDLRLLLFPFIGHFVAIQQIQYWSRAPVQKMHWWYAHMSGMTVAAISAVTAVLVTALPRFIPLANWQSAILWIAPGLILGTVANRLKAKYRQQYGD